MVELLVGLALALCLAAAAAPLWLSLESTGVREGDRTVQWLQGRVAVARLERDLRLASAGGCPFAVSGPLLEAAADQVVFLERARPGAAPILVEWELVGGALMRRWGDCPATRPSSHRHSLFKDHKTMLEGVRPGSAFSYVIEGVETLEPAGGNDLVSVEAVVLTLRTDVAGELGSVRVATTARVGR